MSEARKGTSLERAQAAFRLAEERARAKKARLKQLIKSAEKKSRIEENHAKFLAGHLLFRAVEVGLVSASQVERWARKIMRESDQAVVVDAVIGREKAAASEALRLVGVDLPESQPLMQIHAGNVLEAMQLISDRRELLEKTLPGMTVTVREALARPAEVVRLVALLRRQASPGGRN